jgi:molybdopterin synthase sulfur carrier subunit
MKLKLVYFAWMRDKIGKAEEAVEVGETVKTVADLVNWLRPQSDAYADAFADMTTVRCAINLDYVMADAKLNEGDEVGFFPPVTGG